MDSSHQIQRRLAKGGYRVRRVRLRNDCGFGRNTEDTHACLTTIQYSAKSQYPSVVRLFLMLWRVVSSSLRFGH
ncbi:MULTISPECIES: hypothetical protein [unclassified Tolypothrix]|uniref:hypothetical protein n=1 Tax=unclassified Tolypothrix TaxID=2649714 RepID=UPI0005EAB760|nr:MULTISPECIES: hypothetical protein [unclassified Tolypothrix]EKE98282.1 hypothetical protein FDUTEX481_04438 [Tolypothrix sp. PCC 7601]MBE9083997.1 hypothetical protein [Tolypothrix sp. LEGE 11397]UYD30502.1 hypothetical protein HGR01_37350 [Tolypothrix sp. PCC 7712]UYD38365.1 hypothetical protein HG267_37545 [Tolypothrix sp. PCC 7601]